MGKRKRSSSEKHMWKEIERLKKKLNKRRRMDSTSSSSTDSEHRRRDQLDGPPLDNDDNSQHLSPMHGDVEETVLDQIADTNIDTDITSLDPELIQLLGEDPSNTTKYGENLNQYIIPRWSHILANGLDKETRLELCKAYLPPENCHSTRSPKLNPMIHHFLTDINKKKEAFSENKQNQLSSCLAALGQALNKVLASKENQKDLIKSLSDAGRLLCNYHYKESQSRRYSIINVVNKDLRDTLKSTKIDEFLFGADLADQLKTFKDVTKAASDLKNPRAIPKPRPAPAQRGSLNYRGAVAATSTSRPNPTQRYPASRSGPGMSSRDRDRHRYESSSSRKNSGRGRTTGRR